MGAPVAAGMGSDNDPAQGQVDIVKSAPTGASVSCQCSSQVVHLQVIKWEPDTKSSIQCRFTAAETPPAFVLSVQVLTFCQDFAFFKFNVRRESRSRLRPD